MPAIAEADDGFLYVLKFRGAGQGVKALIAELLGGEIARALGLLVPEIVLAELDEAFGRTEGDEEIQDLNKASTGLNVALHYLSGSAAFDPLVTRIESELASKIVWLDCLIMNVDRTCKNTNMLSWKKELWLIDHGAAFYFHHSWNNWQQKATAPFLYVKDHVLLAQANVLQEVDPILKKVLDEKMISSIVSLIPVEWLERAASPFSSAEEHRKAYEVFLNNRIFHSHIFVNEAQNAKATLI